MIKVKIEPYSNLEGFFTVTPFGPIDYDSYQGFQEKVKPLLEQPIKGIILDLSNVDYISSSGLGSLITMKKTLIAKQAVLYFCNLRPAIKKLFEILRALPNQNVFESTEEADRYLYNLSHDQPEESQS